LPLLSFANKEKKSFRNLNINLVAQGMYDCLLNDFPIYTAKKESYPMLDHMEMRDPQWSRNNEFFSDYSNPFPELYSERNVDEPSFI